MLRFFGICFFAVALWGCWFNTAKKNQGAAYMQGQWLEDSDTLNSNLVEYKQRQFKFICDSFYLILNNSSKANYAQDTCYKNGKWTEYVKGVYSLNGDTITLKGAYVSKTFRFKKTACYTTGNFDETLLKQSNNDSVIVLKSFTGGKVVLKLTERLVCGVK